MATCHFMQICNTAMEMIDLRILFLLNIFRTNGHNFNKCCICITIDKIWVSAQYTENKKTEFYPILYI